MKHDHAHCPPGAHDRDPGTSIDDGQPVDENGLMLCRDCHAPLMYCTVVEDYDHAEPDAPPCFLVPGDRQPETALERIRVCVFDDDWSGVFTAYADRSFRWNGWIGCPWFDRGEATRVADWINDNADKATENDYADARWDGDVLVLTSAPGTEDEHVQRLEPDEHGRYAIGANEWCWTEATTPAKEVS